MRILAVLAVLLVVAALGGCLDAGGGPLDCHGDRTLATPMVDGAYMQTDPAQTWQTVVLSPAGNATATTRLAWSAAPGWNASGRILSPAGTRVFQVATVTPGTAAGNATLSFEVRTADGVCKNREGTSLIWDLATPKPGDSAMPGQGVHVMTAGFFENGTLFYTNIAEVDRDLRWPRVDWYAWEGDLPLPVYVYDADRAEQPAHWTPPSSQVSPLTDEVPATGTPVDDAVAGIGPALDQETGLGYFTTIAGFNQALQGLSTTTTHVVRLTPEEAYTWPGNEEHPLYGHAIVFYIKVLDVVDVPCPHTVQAWMCRAESPMQGGPAE